MKITNICFKLIFLLAMIAGLLGYQIGFTIAEYYIITVSILSALVLIGACILYVLDKKRLKKAIGIEYNPIYFWAEYIGNLGVTIVIFIELDLKYTFMYLFSLLVFAVFYKVSKRNNE